MATNLSSTRHDTHSTTAQGGTWTTKRIVVIALFCALSVITSFIQIPIFPPAPWLTYDPSGVFALIAAFAFGPASGALVVVLSWFFHLLFAFNPYGVIMAVLASLTLCVPAGLIYRRATTRGGALAGMIVGGICSIIACVLGNLVITPLYTAVSVADVAAMILPILVPFNLIKVVLNCVICAIIYKPLSKALED